MDSERIISSLRLQLLIERICVAVALCILAVTWSLGHFGNGKSLILVDGKPIACVRSQKEAKGVISRIKTVEGCNPAEIEFRQEVRVAKAPRDARPVSRHKALAAVRKAVCPLIPRWAIIVNGKPAVGLPDQNTAGETLELAKLKFGKMADNLAEEPQFKESVTVDVAAVEPRLYCRTAEDAVKLLFADRPVETTDAIYTVRNGDVAVLIARRHGLSLEALERMNPGNDLARLQIGDSLHVKAPKDTGPRLTVVVRDQSERTESIPAPVQRVSSGKLFVGKSVEMSPGRSGVRKVKVATIYENGRAAGSEIISEEIIREPLPRRIAMGIKSR